MTNLLLAFVLLVSLVILGIDIGSFPLISPDEPRYAETAREILARADWVLPYCNGIPRFDKPILFYWFEAISLNMFGLNEFAARLPSVLAGTGMVWLAFLLGNIQGFGLVAATMMLTTLQVFLLSKLAITDITLTFFISAAISFFYLGYRQRQEIRQRFALKERPSSYWFVFSFVMMAFGMLCKGPVAVLIPLVVILLFLLWEKDLFDFFADAWIEMVIGLVLFLLISLPWYIAVHFASAGKFTSEFFLGHNLSRYLAVHTNHAGALWYYVPVILIGLFPWSFFLVQAIFSNDFSTKFNLRAESAKAAHLMSFCSLWAAVVFIFFSISQTKLPTYITPIYLPLVIIIAKWWYEKFKSVRSNGYKNIDGLIGLAIMALTILIAAILSLFVFKSKLALIQSSSVFAAISVVAFILLSIALVAMTAMLHRSKVAFAIVAAATLLSYLIATHFILKPFAIHRDAGAKSFASSLKPEDKLATYQTRSAVFSFYAQKPVRELDNEALYKYLKEGTGSRFFVAKTRSLEKFDKHLTNSIADQIVPYQLIKTNKIYSYGKNSEAKPIQSKEDLIVLPKN